MLFGLENFMEVTI